MHINLIAQALLVSEIMFIIKVDRWINIVIALSTENPAY